MSFSSEAKTEMCRIKADKSCCALAECYGILLYCHSFTSGEARIVTANEAFAARLPKLFRKAFGIDFDTVTLPSKSGGKQSFCINSPDKIKKIYDSYGLEPGNVLHINLAVLENECCRISFIRGAFLAGGSVSDPEKSFHLEFSTSHRTVSREASALLRELEFEPGSAERAGSSLIYFKKADRIADILTLTGAGVSGMNVQNAKIEREMNSKITRRVNCDSANADKLVEASQAQLAAIKKLVSVYGLDGLPDELRDAALLRIGNPASSLAELASLSSPPVTKSCLSHRLRKISELAEKLEK